MLNRRRALALGLGLTAASGSAAQAAEPVKIAFVDTGNTGRSLMAETLARALVRRRALPIAVISRGLDVDPFDEAPEANARILMAGRGFDVAAHRAAPLAAQDVSHADLILTMTAAHAAEVTSRYPHARIRTFTLSAYATGADVAIPDAWGKPMADYRAVLAQLDRYLPAALARAVAARPAKQ
jgi:protein-tyrosine phosphatase